MIHDIIGGKQSFQLKPVTHSETVLAIKTDCDTFKVVIVGTYIKQVGPQLIVTALCLLKVGSSALIWLPLPLL